MYMDLFGGWGWGEGGGGSLVFVLRPNLSPAWHYRIGVHGIVCGVLVKTCMYVYTNYS